MKRILVTGANGFIGSNIGCEFSERGINAVAAVRSKVSKKPHGYKSILSVGDISGETDWEEALLGIDVVLHLAAKAHFKVSESKSLVFELKRVNTDGTIRLAQQAADSGVKRFLYLSSIGVHGASSGFGTYTNHSIYAPSESYSASKVEAEQGLKDICKKSGMEFVIVRPPLVYGPDAPGNFSRLMKLVYSGYPLPFGNFQGKKGIISIKNLGDFLVRCIHSPNAANKAFVIADEKSCNLVELVQIMSLCMGKKAKIFSMPWPILVMLARILGQEATVYKLALSTCVDVSETKRQLNWSQPQSTEEGIRHAVEYYLKKVECR